MFNPLINFVRFKSGLLTQKKKKTSIYSIQLDEINMSNLIHSRFHLVIKNTKIKNK